MISTIISNMDDNPANRYSSCFTVEETEAYRVQLVVRGHKACMRQNQALALDLLPRSKRSPLFQCALCESSDDTFCFYCMGL